MNNLHPLLLAYKYVFVAAMMYQISDYAPRMHLPITVPVKECDIRFLHVSEPVILPHVQDYSGRLQVTNYSFTFGLYSHTIINLDQYGFCSFGVPMEERESSVSGMERASRTTYAVTTNDVYRIATNWLAGLDIDIQMLEKINPPEVSTDLFKSNRGWVPSPLLEVFWNKQKIHGPNPAGVSVEVLAVTGEIRTLDDGDGRFRKNRRPLILTNEVNSLLAIPDEEFRKYTEQQRRDLVERFAGIKGNKDFLTNVPTAFYTRISTIKRSPRRNDGNSNK